MVKGKNEYHLMSDVVARKIFKNSPVALELTARIVSEVLHIDYEYVIKNIKITSEDVAFNALNVDNRVDVNLESDTFYVDIEICYTKGITRERQTDSYLYQLYLGQLFKSKDYSKMKKIIQIMIENYDFFGKNQFVYEVVFMERNLHMVESEFIRKIHINVAYLRNLNYNKIKKEKNILKKLLYFLVCEDENRLEEAYEGDEFMGEVVRYARQIAGFENMKLFLPEEEIQRRDRAEAIEIGLEEGRKKGRKEGIKEGRKEGRKEGIKEGRKEGREQLIKEMVINMNNKNYSIEDISNILGIETSIVKNIISTK